MCVVFKVKITTINLRGIRSIDYILPTRTTALLSKYINTSSIDKPKKSN